MRRSCLGRGDVFDYKCVTLQIRDRFQKPALHLFLMNCFSWKRISRPILLLLRVDKCALTRRAPHDCGNFKFLHTAQKSNGSNHVRAIILACQSRDDLDSACSNVRQFDFDCVLSALKQLEKFSVRGKRNWISRPEFLAARKQPEDPARYPIDTQVGLHLISAHSSMHPLSKTI